MLLTLINKDFKFVEIILFQLALLAVDDLLPLLHNFVLVNSYQLSIEGNFFIG